MHRVLVIGGYGLFGGRLAERLARLPSLEVLVAGRNPEAAERLVQRLQGRSAARLVPEALDALADGLEARLRALQPGLVVNASGPFQRHDYRIPSACIAAGCHYVDLADGRAYVSGITALDAAARAAGVLATSGASSVPALSSAVADRLAQGLSSVSALDIGISPGNRTERGLSTMQAVLSYCGQLLPSTRGGPVFGWHGTRRHRYPAPVGRRLLSPCDVPDLALLPQRYPGAPAVRFGAGLELAFLHRGMNLMARATRLGLVRDWSRHARPLLWAADLFRDWGSDAGAMHVTVAGTDTEGRPQTRTWNLVASQGDGPYVPTLAATALVRKWMAGNLTQIGALPCIGLLTVDEILREAEGLHITTEART
jgi:predicted dinucleotide-binding enzyme